jgi:imidazolonepropionase-like amidohydrolase
MRRQYLTRIVGCVVIVVGLVYTPVGRAQAPSAPTARPAATPKATLAIVGGFLIDGFGGPPKPNAVVLIDGDKIVAVGEDGRLAVPAGAKVIDANGYTVMPGLIDTHVHLDLIGHAEYPVWHPLVNAEYADVMGLAAAQLLKHGVTTARDAGGQLRASIDTRDRINRGEIKGSRLLVSGDMLGRWSPTQWQRWYRNKISVNLQNADEARAATKKLIQSGADFIKIRTPLSLEEIKAITAEAHALGKRVGAHVGEEAEIALFVEGGVDLLDHVGSGRQTPLFGEETLRLLARTRVPVGQSDRVWRVYEQRMAWPESLDDPELRQELGKYADVILRSLEDLPSLPYFSSVAQRRLDPLAPGQLYRAGARLVIGSDSGTPANFHSGATWGQMWDLVRAGLTPKEAIAAGTKDAAAALGVNAGVIYPGRLADIILVKGNPLEDITTLDRVAHVVKGGVQYH